MKIKIIDLLNKIANGEEVPKKIKFDNVIFVYIDKWEQYVTKEEEIPLLKRICDYNYSGLNDEVEIIEEDKTIEELKTEIENTKRKLIGTSGNRYSIRVVDNIIINKINELVKEINKLKEN
jgi:hypothetical protein